MDAAGRYAAWLECNAPSLWLLRAALLARWGRLPRISVILIAHKTSPQSLDAAVQSVRSQIYKNWELCIADDGTSDAVNAAAARATGEFLAFLDPGDVLSSEALAEVAIYAADNAEADIIYTDDDKIDASGRRFEPQFKPDWSPTLLLSYMYMGRLLVVRRSLFLASGGMRQGFEGGEDYDLALRASEQARHIGHIPKILCHRRAAPGSASETVDSAARRADAGLRAVKDAFARRNINAAVTQPDWARSSGLEIYAPSFPDSGPRVAILIPTRNQDNFLRSCLESLRKTTYQNFEIVILDDESDDPATVRFLAECGHRVLRVAREAQRFSFAHINNFAVREVAADHILFLNDDTQVVEPRWLSQMMGHASMPGVGAVGAKLIYGENAIQHAGVVHGEQDGLPRHAFRDLPADQWGYLAYLKVAREYSAVTGACLLTSRRLFLEMGGFDETAFALAFNDIDYCFRLNDRGYRCIFCPDATLIHHQGQSRPPTDLPAETRRISAAIPRAPRSLLQSKPVAGERALRDSGLLRLFFQLPQQNGDLSHFLFPICGARSLQACGDEAPAALVVLEDALQCTSYR